MKRRGTDDLEILHVAHYLGYYETPKGCTVRDVADRAGVSVATAQRRLQRAERAAVGQLLAVRYSINQPTGGINQ